MHNDTDPDETAPGRLQHDPDEVTYPEALRLTVREETSTGAALDALAERAEEALDHHAETDEPAPATRTFSDVADLRRLITACRLELIQSLLDAPADSISQLARRLDRNYSEVYNDVELLAHYGVIYLRETQNTTQPIIPYGEVTIDVTLTSHSQRDGSPVHAD